MVWGDNDRMGKNKFKISYWCRRQNNGFVKKCGFYFGNMRKEFENMVKEDFGNVIKVMDLR